MIDLNEISLRSAEQRDLKLLMDWRNESVSRAMSTRTGLISLEEHTKWYASALKGKNYVIYIALDADQHELGVISFVIKSKIAIVSINLDKSHRGRGLGCSILYLGIAQLLIENPDIQIMSANVKVENTSSINMFKKCGFVIKSFDNELYILEKKLRDL